MRQHRMQQSHSVATGPLSDLMEGCLRTLALMLTEADGTAFAFTGWSIAEIAGFRGLAERFCKSHPNAIYRKSDTSGRAQRVSVLVEDLFRGALIGPNRGAKP